MFFVFSTCDTESILIGVRACVWNVVGGRFLSSWFYFLIKKQQLSMFSVLRRSGSSINPLESQCRQRAWTAVPQRSSHGHGLILALRLNGPASGPPARRIVCQSFPRVGASGQRGNTTCGDKQEQERAPEGSHSLV